MSKVILPYLLREGQVAYAARVMADLNALADKLNGVSVPGLADGDIESALQQLKYRLDAEAEADGRAVAGLAYDSAADELVLTLADGAAFRLSMAPFLNDHRGGSTADLTMAVDGDNVISGEINEGAVTYAKLAAALQSLINGKVTSGASGNAAEIVFADGESFQDKLDAGQLRGGDGVTAPLNAIYYFRVGSDGHLYVGVADDAAAPPFAIDAFGHLIYTID